MKSQRKLPSSSKPSYALVIIAFLSTVNAIVFGYLNSTNTGGLFYNNITYLSSKYYNEVTPAGFVFAIIWPIIFLWTLAGSIYLVVSIWLQPDQSPVNYQPCLTPNVYLIAYIFGYGAAVAWFFTFDREYLILSFVMLASGAFSFYTCLGISLQIVYNNLAKLEIEGKTLLWMVRVLLQNGLGLIATWLTLATSIGLTIVLLYQRSFGQAAAVDRGLLSRDDASTLVLAIVSVLMLLYFIVENFVWEKYLRYFFSVYPVLIFAFSGLVSKLSKHETDRSMIVASTNLGLAVALFITRIVLSIYRFSRSPTSSFVKDSCGKTRLLENEKKR